VWRAGVIKCQVKCCQLVIDTQPCLLTCTMVSSRHSVTVRVVWIQSGGIRILGRAPTFFSEQALLRLNPALGEWQGMPSSCALGLLCGFAIGVRVSLVWQQRRTRNDSDCLYSLYTWFFEVDYPFGISYVVCRMGPQIVFINHKHDEEGI